MSIWKIPLFEPDIAEEDINAVQNVLTRRWLTMGEETLRLESSFAKKIRVQTAFAVSSGTAALHLALLALNIQPEDEVLLPSFTFVACANAVKAVGAIPVFVDIESDTDWTISPEDLEYKITPRTRAAIVVHYAGFPCQMNRILSIAQRHNISIIEDCAHALITQYDQSYCGCMGDIGCFSFFSNKNMTTGEGGMIVTQNDELADRIRLLRSHGMTSLTLDRHQGRAISYDVNIPGLNYRIDEMRSALGRSQLKRLDENIKRRQNIYKIYMDCLSGLEAVILPFTGRKTDKIGFHIFPIALAEGFSRIDFMQALKEKGIQTSIHYPPIHLFAAYRNSSESEDRSCPLTVNVAQREVTLPFFPHIREEEVEWICQIIRNGIEHGT